MLAKLNIKWIVINLLAVLLLLSGLWLWQQQVENLPSQVTQEYSPDYFLAQATSLQYDETGQLTSKISGQRFTHIMEFATTDIAEPSFQLFQTNRAAWFGRAENGVVIDSGAQIDLNGSVFITNGPAQENPLSLTSESLKILPQQNLLMGNQQINIQGGQSQLQSQGLKLDMDTQKLNLLSQVKGQLQPGN